MSSKFLSVFYKDFDTILAQMIADYQSQNPDIDISVGTLVFIKSACYSAALYGAYKYLSEIERLPFPWLCSREANEEWASVFEIPNVSAMTDEELALEVTRCFHNPDSSGNSNDWERWAENVTVDDEAVGLARLFEGTRGVGSIDVAITSDRNPDTADYDAWANTTVYDPGDIVVDNSVCYITYSGGTSSGTGVADDTGVTDWEPANESPSLELVAAVETALDAERAPGNSDFEVHPAIKNIQNITMTLYGDDVDDAAISVVEDLVEDYVKGLLPGKTLYLSQLETIGNDAGADNTVVSVPASDIAPATGPTNFERVWPGTINVAKG